MEFYLKTILISAKIREFAEILPEYFAAFVFDKNVFLFNGASQFTALHIAAELPLELHVWIPSCDRRSSCLSGGPAPHVERPAEPRRRAGLRGERRRDVLGEGQPGRGAPGAYSSGLGKSGGSFLVQDLTLLCS